MQVKSEAKSKYICTIYGLTKSASDFTFNCLGDGTACYVEKNGKYYLDIETSTFTDSILVSLISLDSFSNNQNNYQMVIAVPYSQFNIRYGFNFDSNSASASKKFRADFLKYKNTSNQTMYYGNSPGGENIHYSGQMLNNKQNGSGIMFYNNRTNSVMCEGTFKDGQYDGVCTFYDQRGLVKVEFNNISRGKLLDYATLHFDGKSISIDLEDTKYKDILPKTLDVNVNTNICIDLARVHVRDFETRYALMSFKALSDNEKIEYLLLQVNELKLENAAIKERLSNVEKTVKSPFTLGSSLLGFHQI